MAFALVTLVSRESMVVTPRMSVDIFPELTLPVLVIGTLAPGLGPKDVEKTISWRLEKYVSATPGVDHMESVSRNSLNQPLALAVVGGLTSSTVLSLFLVPVMFLLIAKRTPATEAPIASQKLAVAHP